MTVGELKKALSEYPEDTPVMVEWEGEKSGIRREEFTYDRLIPTDDPEEDTFELLINVDNYG
jgi:hypothetical protein